MSIEDWSHKEQTSLSDRLFALHLGSNLALRRGYSGSINALGHVVPMKSLSTPAAFFPITSTSIASWKEVLSGPIYALCKYMHTFPKPNSHSLCLQIHCRCLLPPAFPSPPLTHLLALLPCSNAPFFIQVTLTSPISHSLFHLSFILLGLWESEVLGADLNRG